MFEPKLVATIDTYVNEAIPKKNFGASAALKVDNTGGSEKQTFLSFPIPTQLRGSYIVSATLTMYNKGAWSGAHTLTVRRVTESWGERRVNWDRRPSNSATNAATDGGTTDAADATAHTFNVTAMLQDVADGQVFYGMRLTIGSNGVKSMYSSENNDISLRPYLTIQYVTGTEGPLDVQPNGQVCYSDSPVLSWFFASKTPGAVQTQSQVQVTLATDDDFSSTLYDSGQQANVSPHWDLDNPPSGPAYTPMTESEDYIWRVKAYDGNSWSPWSDVATISWEDPGVVDITFPAIDNDDVSINPPTVEFDFTVQDLASFTPQLFKLVGATYVEITDGTFGAAYPILAAATTDGEWTLPVGILSDTVNNRHKVRITARDTFNRIMGRGDEPYDERIFDYVPNGALTVPAGAVATLNGPYVRLDFTYTDPRPDYFMFSVDGLHVARVAASTIEVSNEVFQYDLLGLTPSVTAQDITVAGLFDATGISDELAFSPFIYLPKGIWLCRGSDVAVRLDGRADIEETKVQDGETYYPQGRTTPVRLTGPAKGYEASISGVLLDQTDQTALEGLELIEDMIDDYGESGDLSVIYGDRYVTCLVGEFSKSHNPEYTEGIMVNFHYWETDEFRVVEE